MDFFFYFCGVTTQVAYKAGKEKKKISLGNPNTFDYKSVKSI